MASSPETTDVSERSDMASDSDSELSAAPSDKTWEEAYGPETETDPLIRQLSLTNKSAYVGLRSKNPQTRKNMARKLQKYGTTDHLQAAVQAANKPFTDALTGIMKGPSQRNFQIPLFDLARSPKRDNYNIIYKACRLQFDKPTPDVEIQFLIEAICRMTCENRITKGQFLEMVQSFVQAEHKREIRSLIQKNMDLEPTLRAILEHVAPVEDLTETRSRFWDFKYDPQNSMACMDKLYRLGLRAFPDEADKEFDIKLENKLMSILPPEQRLAIEEKKRQREHLRACGVHIPPFTWADMKAQIMQFGIGHQTSLGPTPKQYKSRWEHPPGQSGQVRKTDAQPTTPAQQQVQGPSNADILHNMHKIAGDMQALKTSVNASTEMAQGAIHKVTNPLWMTPSPPVQQPTPAPPEPKFPSNPEQSLPVRWAQGGTPSKSGGGGNKDNRNWALHFPGRGQNDIASQIEQPFKRPDIIKRPSYDPSAPKLPYKFENGKYIPTCPPFDPKKPITKGDVRNVKRISLTKEGQEFCAEACFKCGEVFCSPFDSRCLYFHGADTWNFCQRCRRGFHPVKDCKMDSNL